VNDLVVYCLCGHAPVQSQGTVSGFPYYFRARGDRWQFAVATGFRANLRDAVDVVLGRAEGFYVSRSFGTRGGLDASVMEERVALVILEGCARKFVAYYRIEEKVS